MTRDILDSPCDMLHLWPYFVTRDTFDNFFLHPCGFGLSFVTLDRNAFRS